ncbi:murein L,D-transpeptidase catalytic domain family protein [Tsuneonella sp. HG249]
MDEVGLPYAAQRRRFLAGAGIAVAGLSLPLLSSALREAAPRAAMPATPRPAPDLTMPRLYPRAMAALERHADLIAHRDRIAVVDFAQPSREPRFHLIDLESGRTDSLLVSHGSGSDPDRSGWLQRFSNVPDSKASSRGAYLTGQAYVGKHGRSRRLVGLDRDNDLAEPRAIVIHGADYVSEAMASAQGLIGRSQGCFAFAEDAIEEVLERLGEGRLLFAWK